MSAKGDRRARPWWIKEVLGFRRFSLRGVVNAYGEWNVVCLAANLKRLHRLTMA
jgi:hypothetical protein